MQPQASVSEELKAMRRRTNFIPAEYQNGRDAVDSKVALLLCNKAPCSAGTGQLWDHSLAALEFGLTISA